MSLFSRLCCCCDTGPARPAAKRATKRQRVNGGRGARRGEGRGDGESERQRGLASPSLWHTHTSTTHDDVAERPTTYLPCLLLPFSSSLGREKRGHMQRLEEGAARPFGNQKCLGRCGNTPTADTSIPQAPPLSSPARKSSELSPRLVPAADAARQRIFAPTSRLAPRTPADLACSSHPPTNAHHDSNQRHHEAGGGDPPRR